MHILNKKQVVCVSGGIVIDDDFVALGGMLSDGHYVIWCPTEEYLVQQTYDLDYNLVKTDYLPLDTPTVKPVVWFPKDKLIPVE